MQHQGRKFYQDRKCNSRLNMKCNNDVENAELGNLRFDDGNINDNATNQ